MSDCNSKIAQVGDFVGLIQNDEVFWGYYWKVDVERSEFICIDYTGSIMKRFGCSPNLNLRRVSIESIDKYKNKIHAYLCKAEEVIRFSLKHPTHVTYPITADDQEYFRIYKSAFFKLVQFDHVNDIVRGQKELENTFNNATTTLELFIDHIDKLLQNSIGSQ